MNYPHSRRARALRALGLTLAILAAIVAAPIIMVKLFADLQGDRR